MEIYYETSEGNKIYLDRNPYYMLDSSNIVNYEWEYQTNSTIAKISGFTRNLKTKDIDIAIVSTSKVEHKADINNLVEKIENDIVATSPGRLYMGDYYLSCYFVKSKKQSRYETVKKAIVNFSIIVEKDMWIKESTLQFRYADLEVDTTGKYYPHNYPYNYGLGGGYNSYISVEAFGSMDFIINIYGYAHNPEICIGEHVYKVDYTIQPGEVLTIDSRKHKILLTKTNGITMNMFRYRDIRHYIFGKITAGELPVYWNGSYDWDILLLEERSEPEWK